MNIYKDLTIFFVSYYSKKNIEKILINLNHKIKILIIDNANEPNLKQYFEKKFTNVKVIRSKINKGQSGGINLGFKNIKTNYSIYMDSDINFDNKIITKFISIANKINDFIILGPKHEKNFYKKNFIANEKSNFKNLTLMKMIHGHFMFFNMKFVKKNGYFDENFFLYFEETDYCLRAYRKKMKIYVLDDINVIHKSGWSVDIKNKLEIEANKHWHYMWSKFYFYKKNFSLFTAYVKTLKDFLTSFLKFSIFLLIDNRKKTIYLNQFLGLLNCYFGKSSYRRLKIN